ncbi:MAG: choice-of-anchor Q domain-containing protein [Planctomycetota bacterium]
MAYTKQLKITNYRRLKLEALEDRRMLATLTVDNALDGDLAALAGDGQLSLREAIEIANTGTTIDGFSSSDVADTITFSPIAFPNGVKTNIFLAGFELHVTESLTISGENDVVISGDGFSRVLRVGEAGASAPDVELIALDIAQGNSSTETNPNGGGILLEAGVLRVVLGTFFGNSAGSNSGGAIANIGGDLEINGTTFLLNNGNQGGAIYDTQNLTVRPVTIFPNGSEELVPTSFISNSATDGGGGLFASGSADISGSVFSSNSADEGGGAYLKSPALTSATIVITDSSFAGNTASRGGGIYADTSDSGFLDPEPFAIKIERSSISGNTADERGGGVYSSTQNSAVEIRDSTLSGNTATNSQGTVGEGGGLFAYDASRAEYFVPDAYSPGMNLYYRSGTRVINSTISGNVAALQGGGISIHVDSVDPANLLLNGTQLLSSTITQNQLDNDINNGVDDDVSGGAGLYAVQRIGPYFNLDQRLSISNTIIAGNGSVLAPSDPIDPIEDAIFQVNEADIDSQRMELDLSNLLVGSKTAGANLIQFDVLATALPGLGNLADNGGFTVPDGSVIQTHALFLNSPAVEAGDAALFSFLVTQPQSDQRGVGFDRVVGNALDIGAVELQNSTLVVNSSSDNSQTTPLDFTDSALTLREAIHVANLRPGPDTITFDPAVFTGGAGSLIRLNGSGLVITDTVQIDGSTGVDVTITGDVLGNDVVDTAFVTDLMSTSSASLDDNLRVLHITGSSGLTLNSVTITGGLTTSINDNGGGILFNSTDDLLLTNSTVRGNYAGLSSGGGIFLGSGTLVLSDSNVSGNLAGNEGGGVYTHSGSVTLTHSMVSGNLTTGAFAAGGGIYSYSGPIALTNSTVSENLTYWKGGGIFTRHGAVTLTNSTISGNTTDGDFADGGGIYSDTGGVTLTDSTVSGNSTIGLGADGGGIFSRSGDTTLNRSTVSGNSTTGDFAGGGGIYTRSGTVILTDSTVVANASGGIGGGIGFDATAYVPLSQTLTISNSIIAGNSDIGIAPDFIAPSNRDTDLIVTHSLIGDAVGTGLTATSLGVPDAAGNLIGGAPDADITELRLEVDVAAMGNFELNQDLYRFSYRFADVPSDEWTTLLDATVDEAATQTYTLANGSQPIVDDPLLMGSAALSNQFTTLTATGIQPRGRELEIRFETDTDGGSEAFAFKNLKVFVDSEVNPFGQSVTNTNDIGLVRRTIDADFSDLGDMFGLRRGRLAADLPFAIIDDSIADAADMNGIIPAASGEEFFGVVDTRNDENIFDPADPAAVVKQAIWTFAVPSDEQLDPLLAPLADNGGPTHTHALLLGSPALDAGDPAVVFDPAEFDQRGDGFSRVAGGRIDMGAFELQDLTGAASFTGSYTQVFDTLSNANDTTQPWANDTTLAGWHLLRQPFPGVPVDSIQVGDGSATAGAFYSFGEDGNTDRALGGVGSGGSYFGSPASGDDAGWMALSLSNDTGGPVENLGVFYTGEQWRDSGNDDPQTMRLEYGFGDSFTRVPSWMAVGPDGQFTSPLHSETSPLSGNLVSQRRGAILGGLAWAAGDTLWLRWVEENNTGTDHGLAIDDVEVVALAQPASLVVDTVTDELDSNFSTGDLSLREAVIWANGIDGPDTITFDLALDNQTIVLSLGQVEAEAGASIDASALPSGISIDAQDLSRVFDIRPGEEDTAFKNLWLKNGNAGEEDGGAIRFRGNSRISIERTAVSDSSGARGGGIAASNLEVFESEIRGNSAITGGGIYVYQFGDVSIQGSTVSGNHGGGVYAAEVLYSSGEDQDLNSSVSILSSTISGNAAGHGVSVNGFLFEVPDFVLPENALLRIQDSTIVDNGQAGIYFEITEDLVPLADYQTVAVIENAIVANNNYLSWADIEFGAQQNVALSGSYYYRVGGGNIDPRPYTLMVSGSIIGEVFGQFAVPNDLPTALVGNSGAVDPLLGSLDENGGFTLPHGNVISTHQPLVGSPAIDNGIFSEFFAAAEFDQRGTPYARVAGGRIDIGAFEAQETPSLLVTTTLDVVDEFDQLTSLREAIGFANDLVGPDTITFDPAVFTGGAASLIRLNGTELEITDTLTIDGSTGADVTITGDAFDNDVVDAAFITAVDASLTSDATSLDDNSRVLNFTASTGDLTLQGLTITGGRTVDDNEEGGGIRFASDGELRLTGGAVSGNSTAGNDAEGGGIYTLEGWVTLEGGTVAANSTTGAGSHGGGVVAERLTVRDSTISGNSTNGAASDGGGVFIYQLVDVTGSTFSGNTATGKGGGLRTGGETAIVNSTIVRNASLATVDGGGGLSNADDLVTITNSILAENTASAGSPDLHQSSDGPAAIFMVSHSIISDVAGMTAAQLAELTAGVGTMLGDSTAGGAIDPRLDPLTDNGGPTETHLPLAGSPAIDAGDPSVVFDPAEFDQRGVGFARVFDARLDIGSSEVQETLDLVVTTDADAIALDGRTSLREAIAIAAASTTPRTIVFDATLDGGTILLDDALGTLNIDASMTISATALPTGMTLNAGNGLDNLFNTGDGYAVFNVDDNLAGANIEVTLAGLTITGGDGTDGGAIVSVENLTLNAMQIVNNAASSRGGGLFGRGTVEINDGEFSGNTATRGGGVFAEGDLVVRRATLTSNDATASHGGAISSLGVTMLDATSISGNDAELDGGGVWAQGPTTIVGASIGLNDAGRTGGGVYAVASAMGDAIGIAATSIFENTASVDGGGLYGAGPMSIENSSVYLNSAARTGGGLRLATDTTGDSIVLQQLTVSANTAGRDAGGVWIQQVDGEGDAQIDRSTITLNVADADANGDGTGGGVVIAELGTAEVLGSIIAGNQANSAGKAIDITGDSSALSGLALGQFNLMHSLVGDNFGSGLTESQSADAEGNLIGSAAGSGVIDAVLSALADNGGPTETHLPLAGSPAIDAGDPSVGYDLSMVDQRGEPFTRVLGGRIDIGAVESEGLRPLSLEVANVLGLAANEVANLDAGLLVWLDGSDSTTLITDGITGAVAWLDKSGNDNDAEQPDGTSSPIRSGNWVNFSPDADAAGPDNDDFLSLTIANAPTGAWTGTVVFEVDGNSSDQGLVNPIPFTAAGFSVTHDTNQAWAYYGNGSNNERGPAAVGEPHLAISAWTGGVTEDDQNFWIDGVKATTDDGAPVPNNDLASQLLIGSANTPLDGRIGAVIIHSGALSQMARQQLEAYMAVTWGVPLPPGHAFAPSADFNQDGDVDGHDFLAWQRGFGATENVTLATGDANGDEAVDAEDFALWSGQYSQASTLAALASTSIDEALIDEASADIAPELSAIEAALVMEFADSAERDRRLTMTEPLREAPLTKTQRSFVPMARSSYVDSEFDYPESGSRDKERQAELAWMSDELLEKVFS